MKKTNTTPQTCATILDDLRYCVFDLETTGGNTKTDKIIEIGLVNIDGKEIMETKTMLIDPKQKIPEFIQKLTSIKQADVEGCKTIDEVIDEVLEFIGDRILVAHNASFDVPFLNSVLKRLNREELKNKSMCTNLMTKYLIPTLMNSNLNYMSKIFKIQHKKAHRALDDAKATAKLFINYLDIFENKGISKINHLYYPMNRFELDLVNYKKGVDHEVIKNKIKNMPAPFIVTFKGENGVILYAIPGANSLVDHEYIFAKIQEIQWENLSIKLVGPYLEVLFKFGHIYSKLDPDAKKDIIENLWDIHFAKIDRRELSYTAAEIEKYDYVIMNNLVPEQYSIYPLGNLNQKAELVFRYPGHKKKLLQYIGSKNQKTSSKAQKLNVNPQIREFILSYLAKIHLDSKEIFLFDKNGPNKEIEFFDAFERYIAKNKNIYNYPQKYI